MSTTMLGKKVDMPFYVTATALGKLGHPEGEVLLTRGARKHNVIQMIPTLASCSFDEIMDAAEGGQVQWLQLYVSRRYFPCNFHTEFQLGQQGPGDYEKDRRARRETRLQRSLHHRRRAAARPT
jgi:hypothetical protein